MKTIDRHVVERPAAGPAVVPGRIDVREHVLALPYPLSLVVGAKRGAGRGPGQAPEIAIADHLADAPVVRAQHLAGRGDQLHAVSLCAGDQVIRLLDLGAHGLIEMDVLAGINSRLPLLVVQADRRGEAHGIAVAVPQQVVIAFEGLRHPEPVGSRAGASGNRITDGRHAQAVLHVRHGAVG